MQPLAGTLCSLLGVWLQRGGAPEPFLPPPQRPWGRFWQGGQQRAEPSSFFFQPEPHRATNEPILFIFIFLTGIFLFLIISKQFSLITAASNT